MSAEDRAFDAWREQGEAYQSASEREAWDGPDEVELIRRVGPDKVELTCSVCGSWYAIAQDGIFRHYLIEHPESVQASAIRQWLSQEE